MRNFFLALIAISAITSASAQSAAPSPAPTAPPARQAYTPHPTPADPKEFMLQAANFNGLSGDGIQPWHLKATFQILDDTGGVKETGIYEGFWVSDNKYKRTITGNSFSITDYGTEKGNLRVVSGNSLTLFPVSLDFVWTKPIMNVESIKTTTFSQTEKEFGNIKLNCVTVIRPTESSPYPALFGTTFCFTPGELTLRTVLTGQGARQVNRNRIISYQGRAIAGDVAIAMNGKFVLKAHLDLLEELGPINETDLVPPADAKPSPKVISISGGVMAGMILNKVEPVYPQLAQAKGIQGTVVLSCVIDRDGKIINVEVVSGPQELQQAAVEAVRKWVYRPYLLNGEPVQVKTQINVVFSLSH